MAPSAVQQRVSILESILEEEATKNNISGKNSLLKVLVEVAERRRVSRIELERLVDQDKDPETSRADVVKSIDVLKDKDWIDSVDSPVPELNMYFMTAAGLSAIGK